MRAAIATAVVASGISLVAARLAFPDQDSGMTRSSGTQQPRVGRGVVSASGYDLTPLPDEDKAALATSLDPLARQVLLEKGTERASSGRYWNEDAAGVYVGALGGLPLFSSEDKFHSGTGWPSFVRPIDPAHVVERIDRSHGMVRVEILDARSGGHLGHVFDDGPAPTGRRYCVNSAALRFIPAGQRLPVESRPLHAASVGGRRDRLALPSTELATFGAGCFWGVEAELSAIDGVVATAVGYSGGHTEFPTYGDVCSDETGHAEVVRLEYDPKLVSYASLLQKFWSSHDPTTPDRQGPDVGSQYRSVIFYHSDDQRSAAEASMAAVAARLRDPVVTRIQPAATFWRAEEHHQRYLEKRGGATCGSHSSGP